MNWELSYRADRMIASKCERDQPQPTREPREEHQTHKHRAWQTEYFKLAAVYLLCRLRVIQGKGDLHFELLGMRDYAHEMKLLLSEERERRIA
jgi:hypothetical protein